MKGFNFLVNSKVARICDEYAKRQGLTPDDSMKIFLGSTTYLALNDAETGLYLEVFEFVYDMFLEEMGVILE